MPTLKTSKARENILSKIRKTLGDAPTPMPFPEVDKDASAIYPTDLNETAEERFAAEFIQLGGKFVFCDTEDELCDYLALLKERDEWKKLLCADAGLLATVNGQHIIAEPAEGLPEGADACITKCEALIARTGSIVISSAQQLGRTSTVFYPVHIVIAYIDQVLLDIDEALTMLNRKYKNKLPSLINLATGPSRTADIEKTLVVGVHGPAEVYCFLVNEEKGSFYL